MKKFLVGLGLLFLFNGVLADSSSLEPSIKQMLTAAKSKQSTSSPRAPQAAGQMLLRDAIYLYNLPIRAGYIQMLSGYGCDVFQLVLDLESGHSDIVIDEGLYEGGYIFLYPDRIFDHAAMFAYALYTGFYEKTFSLADAQLFGAPGVDPASIVGRATAFGYCFSTNPAAVVVYCDELNNRCYFSNEINPW